MIAFEGKHNGSCTTTTTVSATASNIVVPSNLTISESKYITIWTIDSHVVVPINMTVSEAEFISGMLKCSQAVENISSEVDSDTHEDTEEDDPECGLDFLQPIECTLNFSIVARKRLSLSAYRFYTPYMRIGRYPTGFP